jgi:hypothetical protein
LIEVLAFLSVESVFTGVGLNAASWLLSTLISQHHPAIKRLFGKSRKKVECGMLEIVVPIPETADCLYDEEETGADSGGSVISKPRPRHSLYYFGIDELPSKSLPFPLVPTTQEILGLGNVSLMLSPSSHLYSHEVCFIY